MTGVEVYQFLVHAFQDILVDTGEIERRYFLSYEAERFFEIIETAVFGPMEEIVLDEVVDVIFVKYRTV
jgi:hypothetical protein